MEARTAGPGGGGYNEALLHKVGLGTGEGGAAGPGGCTVHGVGVLGRRESN